MRYQEILMEFNAGSKRRWRTNEVNARGTENPDARGSGRRVHGRRQDRSRNNGLRT